MGTRSHTHFQNREGTILATMYRQYDGYPRGHGMDIYRFFMDEELDRTFFPNGYPAGMPHYNSWLISKHITTQSWRKSETMVAHSQRRTARWNPDMKPLVLETSIWKNPD